MPEQAPSYFIRDDDCAFSEDLAEPIAFAGCRAGTAGDP